VTASKRKDRGKNEKSRIGERMMPLGGKEAEFFFVCVMFAYLYVCMCVCAHDCMYTWSKGLGWVQNEIIAGADTNSLSHEKATGETGVETGQVARNKDLVGGVERAE
jgi:hypothetical protein